MKNYSSSYFYFPHICEHSHKSLPECEGCRRRWGSCYSVIHIICKTLQWALFCWVYCACRGLGSSQFPRGVGNVKLQPRQLRDSLVQLTSVGFCAPNCWSDLISKPLSWHCHFKDKANFQRVVFQVWFSCFAFLKSFRPVVAGKCGKY